ncbi:MAG: hypothetical protein ACLFNU_13295 [Bacteroidales bacterium]
MLKTRKEIAAEMGVSTKTIYRCLKKQGLRISRNVYLSHEEQQLIIQALERYR